MVASKINQKKVSQNLRTNTDKSLEGERAKTDDVVNQKNNKITNETEEEIQSNRVASDKERELIRVEVDFTSFQSSHSEDKSLALEREQSDKTNKVEREKEDKVREKERIQKRQISDTLLKNERKETDTNLHEERAKIDGILDQKSKTITKENPVAVAIGKELVQANELITKELADSNAIISKELIDSNAMLAKTTQASADLLAKTTQASSDLLRKSNEISSKIMNRLTIILVVISVIQIVLATISVFNRFK